MQNDDDQANFSFLDRLGLKKIIDSSAIFSNKWLVLLSFSFLSCTNAMQWNTFSPISRLAQSYFEVPSINIDAFSFIFFLTYVLFVLPACWVIYRYPLNFSIIIGGGLFNCLGSWIRVIGVILPISPSAKFYVVFLGQTISACSQCFMLQVPPLISNLYFEPNERALATSIGFVWNQLGIAVSFLLSPFVLGDNSTKIPLLLLINSFICTLSFLSLIFLAKSKPKNSENSNSVMVEMETVTNLSSICKINKSFVILLVSYGINMGVFFSFTTLLDQIIGYYKYSSFYTGWFGFAIIIVGLFGAFFSGFLLDQTKKFKELLILFYCGTALSTVGFGLVLNPKQEILVGIACCAIGFFMSAIMPLSFESSIEATHLEMPEELNTGLLMLSSMIFGIGFLVILNQFIQRQMMREAIIFLSFSCFISYLLLYLFDAKYKRLQRETKDQENPEETVGIMTKENFLSDNSGQDIIDYGSSSDSSSNSF